MGVKDLSHFVTWTMLQFYSAQQNIYNKSCYPIMHNVKSQRNICIQLKCLTLMHPNIYMFNRLMNVNSYNLNYKLNLYQNMQVIVLPLNIIVTHTHTKKKEVTKIFIHACPTQHDGRAEFYCVRQDIYIKSYYLIMHNIKTYMQKKQSNSHLA